MDVQPEMVAAIMALFGIGLMGIIETLKRILKLDGVGAIILALVVSLAGTAIILVQAGTWSVLAFVVYGLIVFGEASGLYHVFVKKTA